MALPVAGLGCSRQAGVQAVHCVLPSLVGSGRPLWREIGTAPWAAACWLLFRGTYQPGCGAMVGVH